MADGEDEGRELTAAERASKYYTWLVFDYVEAFRILNRERGGDWHLSQVKIYILGHALETVLKGWLVLKENASPKRLKRLGHNLSQLARAVAPYYPEIKQVNDALMPGGRWLDLIDHINDNYLHKDYQYGERAPGPDTDDTEAQAALQGARAGFSPLIAFADMIERCLAQLSHEIDACRRSNTLAPTVADYALVRLAEIQGNDDAEDEED